MIRHYSRTSIHKRLEYGTAKLWEDMVSPLCGILTKVYAYHRQSHDPKGIAIGGELTGVAAYKNIGGSLNYHIGGMGLTREDAMIKCLAESYERYAPVMYDPEKYLPSYFGSYEELTIKYPADHIPRPATFQYFSAAQHQRENFFAKFQRSSPMLWVRTPEGIRSGQFIWLPAHLLFFGYVPKKELGEYRINSAVSTGTAVHRTLVPCMLNSLLEITMIDAAIAHWYTNHRAYKIEMSERTRHIEKIIKKSAVDNNLEVEFYWLPSLEFPTFNVACIARSEVVPKFSIGLGADACLERAMYKAFVEYFGTRFLSNTLAVLQDKPLDPANIQNLDDNVLYYALGNGREIINKKFNPKYKIKAADLPGDGPEDKAQMVSTLFNWFKNTDKQVSFTNFSNAESQQLGLVATKLWSPQLITVPLPFAVPVEHKRFLDYGGITNHEPHPYA